VASSVAAILLGLPIDKVPGVLEKGIGNILGGLLGIVCIGAMFGKLVANSGAAQKIAMVLMRVFGEKHLTWALMFTGLPRRSSRCSTTWASCCWCRWFSPWCSRPRCRLSTSASPCSRRCR
jgi:hypothetical protein